MEPQDTIAEIKRVLKTGGYLIATVPNMYDLRTRLLFPFGVKTKITYGSNLGHIRFFSKNTFTELIKNEGFEICMNTSYLFTHYAVKAIALMCYIISFIRNPIDLKGLRLRKQNIMNSFDFFLSKMFGFTDYGCDLLILAKK